MLVLLLPTAFLLVCLLAYQHIRERRLAVLVGIDLDEMEKRYVLEALRRTDWNQTEAARMLNISVDRMNNRVKKWNLNHETWRVNRGAD